MSEFPHKVKMLRSNWNPGVQFWLRTNAGVGNFQYRRPKDAYTYLQYGFRNQEDATAFKIKFG